MTISELFEYVDAILENAFPDKIKLRWLNQVEAEIQIDVLLMAPEGIVQYTEADLNAELIVPTYYDQLYHEYLFWQICLAQQEDERANKYAVTYNRVYNEYVRFVCETVNPGDGMAEKVRYYLTAYQIAVKHGYTGTEAEWLKNLKGDKGDKGDGLQLLGVKETEAELPEIAENGDAYLVGTTEENNLHVYDNGWKNMGPLRGKDGTSVTVASVQESSESGGTNIVNFSNGNTLHVKNGQDGGHYTPKVSQPSESTMKVSFTPSKADMPSVAEVNVTLPAGADGKTPTKGVDYFDGITPHIGNNGNWFIGDTDTGKPSRGEEGEDGSDASVTAENIEAALGYKPAHADDMVAGVHVGPEPPDDPNVKVWIDTDEEPEPMPKLTINGVQYDGTAPVSVETRPLYVAVTNTGGRWTIGNTLAEIEAAYQAKRPVGLTYSSATLAGNTYALNLVQRYSATDWLFGGIATAAINVLVRLSSSGNTETITTLAKQDQIPTALKNPNALTINGTSYDGSAPVEMTIQGGGGGASEPDWNAAEGEPGHILNRTHWSKICDVTVAPEQDAIYVEEDGLFAVMTLESLKENVTYTVTWNGVIYDVTSFYSEDFGLVACGNMGLTGGEDTGEPFLILDMGGAFAAFSTDSAVAVSVIRSGEVVQRLPAKYLKKTLDFALTDGQVVRDYREKGWVANLTVNQEDFDLMLQGELFRVRVYDYVSDDFLILDVTYLSYIDGKIEIEAGDRRYTFNIETLGEMG